MGNGKYKHKKQNNKHMKNKIWEMEDKHINNNTIKTWKNRKWDMGNKTIHNKTIKTWENRSMGNGKLNNTK